MIAVDDPDAVVENGVFLLDTIIRRQAALRFAERHRAAACMETSAEIGGSLDEEIHLVAAAEKVGMVENGCAP